jgi:hypothetical protein
MKWLKKILMGNQMFTTNRKVKLTLLVFCVSTLLVLIPFICALSHLPTVTVLSGSEYVSIISIVFSALFASNAYITTKTKEPITQEEGEV